MQENIDISPEASPTLLLTQLLQVAGASSWRAFPAEAVESRAVEEYMSWLRAGRNAGMDYMDRWHDVRNDPRLLIRAEDGGPVRTLIVCLFAYPVVTKAIEGPRVADFAVAREDYHRAVRKSLLPVVRELCAVYGGKGRVCVDSAPVRERYWAARAGLGVVGRNNHLRVPGIGAHFHIATIALTTDIPGLEPLPPLSSESPCPADCDLCVLACPNGALSRDGHGCDAAKCLAYRTVELGEQPSRTWLFGCDVCRNACPQCRPRDGAAQPSVIPGLQAHPEALSSPIAWAAARRRPGKRRN